MRRIHTDCTRRQFTLQRLALLCFTLSLFLLMPAITCQAGDKYTNPDTGYRVIVEDDAELLTEEEEQALAETMKDITSYGNAAFKSIYQNSGSTDAFAEDYYHELFGTDSGTLFVIDMDNRNIYIFSDGKLYQTVTKSYALTITDNVYRYASDAKYFDCANEALAQINDLLVGSRIMQPMKYISNALLAMVLALLLCFAWVSFYARLKKPKDQDIMKHTLRQFNYTPPTATYKYSTETYDPVDSGSSSSSGGGGRSGGGGSSGGGGGHSF